MFNKKTNAVKMRTILLNEYDGVFQHPSIEDIKNLPNGDIEITTRSSEHVDIDDEDEHDGWGHTEIIKYYNTKIVVRDKGNRFEVVSKSKPVKVDEVRGLT